MESTAQQTSEGRAVVAVLAAVLERLVNSNTQVPNGENITKFHALKAPAISIHQYLERIHKYASCSTECFILALIYIDRLIQRNHFLLSELNVHRVCITAVLLAAKFFDDAYYNNAYYAKVGGVLVSEMNGLEVEFLFRINFSLHVTPEEFIKYQEELISHAIGAGMERPPEVAIPDCIQPPTPPVAVQQIHVPVPNISGPNVSHNIDSNAAHAVAANPTTYPQHQEYQQNTSVCMDMNPSSSNQPQHQQGDWAAVAQHPGNVTATANHNQAVQGNNVNRHITPSPPHANAVHETMRHNSFSASSSTRIQNDVHHRPRHNSYPIDSFPIVDTHYESEPILHHYDYSQSSNMCKPTDVLPCSHYGRQVTADHSPHLVSTSTGVYP
jgi:formylmethanofuran dehydrogenase subunit D